MRLWMALAAVLGVLAGQAMGQVSVDLSWGWRAGEERVYRLTERMLQQVSGEFSESLEWTRELTYRERVLGVDEDGSARVEREYDAVRVEARGDSVERVEYDSEDASTDGARSSPLVAPFAGMVGQKVTFTITRDGKVMDAQGAGEMWDSMLGPLRESAIGGLLQGVTMQRDGEALRRQIEEGMAMIPGKTVRPRDRWETDVEHQTPLGVVRSEIEHAFRGFKRRGGERYARIVSSGRLESGPEDDDGGGIVAQLTKLAGLRVRLADSEIDGETLFDDERGRIARQEMTVRTSWEIEVDESSGLGDLVGESTQTIEQFSVLELIDG